MLLSISFSCDTLVFFEIKYGFFFSLFFFFDSDQLMCLANCKLIADNVNLGNEYRSTGRNVSTNSEVLAPISLDSYH